MQTLRRSVSLLVLLTAAATFANAQNPLRLVNVTPCRLVDTRQLNNGSGFQGTMTFNLPQLAMNGGNQGQCTPFSLASAQAYSLNVTLVTVNSGHVGYLTIWPTGEPQPLVSLMNSDGRSKANAAIVPAGTNGEVSVYVTNTTNVLIDINAYFDYPGTDPSDLAFFPLTPCRLVDTRSGNGGTLVRGQERDYLIPPTCGIPTDAKAYSFNVTVLPASGGLDYLTVWPQGEPMPVVSTLNDVFHGQGTPAANAAIVPAGMNNTTAFYPHSNNTDLLVDVNGYFAAANSAPGPLSLFTLTPCRVLDTRGGIGEFTGTIPVGVVGSLCGIPGSTSEAFVLNATVIPDAGTHLSYLTLWPEGETMPTVSTLNASDGAVTSNMAIVPAGMGNDSINAFAGEQGRKYTNLILDIASYFAPIPVVNILNSSLPDGVRGSNYSAPLVASGGVGPYTWMKTSGNLPTGLSLDRNTGIISGNPSNLGTFMFTVQATDSDNPAGMATANLQITVDASAQTLSITTLSLPGGTINTPYNALLTANGGMTPYTWSIVAGTGTLPVGLSLAGSTGQITGVPGAAGLSQFTVMATDALNHSVTASFAIAVDTGAANGTLNGMYAFSFTAYNASTQTPFVVAGSLTMDGNGHITGGEYDFNGSSNGVQHSTVTGGGYTLTSNGLGQLNFADNTGANIQLLIAIGDADASRVISMETSGQGGFWGAGVFRQQNPGDFLESLGAGTWAFSYQGFDSSIEPLAGAGAYTEDSSGNITGAQDINDFGTHIQTTFTGRVTSSPAIDGNGRSTVQYQVGGGVGTINLAVYTISYGEIVGIEGDSASNIYVTNAIRQSTSNFNNSNFSGNSVGRGSRQHGAGGGNPDSQASVLLLQANGGNVTIDEYDNTGGTVESGTQTGTYSVSSNGRMPLNFAGGEQVVCYLIETNEGYCINTVPTSGGNVKGAEAIFFEPQVGGPYSLASLSGQYSGGSLPQYVSSTASSIDTFFTDGAGNGSFTGSESGPGGIQQQVGSGTYTVSSSGLVTVLSGGSAEAYGYVVNPSKFEIISTDDNPRLLIHLISDAP